MAGILTVVVILIIIFALTVVLSNYSNISNSLKDAETQGRIAQYNSFGGGSFKITSKPKSGCGVYGC
ncbi:MAG: hypothetical protein J4452_04055 [Candidatus Aenigmarchaeota archaeon]|nr:hypothetical protein [Candidatus Aenigmarchaeota archaeon]